MSCDGCSVATINGVRSHEHGCPEAWREDKECKSCGSRYTPEHRDQEFCDYECYACYHGIDTWSGDEELWDETELEAV